MDLQSLVEKFVDEQIEFRKMNIKQAVHIYQELIGNPPYQQFSGGTSMSFFQFLKAARKTKLPQITDLTKTNIGDYQDFLEQFYGLVKAKSFIRAMHKFWTWTANNGFFVDPIKPPRLKVDDAAVPTYQVRLMISDKE